MDCGAGCRERGLRDGLAGGGCRDTGIVAGVLVTYMIEIAELHLVDDPGGAVSVHAGAGIWGLIAVGIFGHFPEGHAGQP